MPFIIAGLCVLVLKIWDRLDWYGSTGNNKAVARIWIAIGVVIFLIWLFSKAAY